MIDVVIVNWNGGELITSCISSLLDSSKNSTPVNIVVVDNNSSDGSSEAANLIAGVTVIYNSKNEGFARACNQGANAGKSELLVFLNPDTKITSDIFPKLEQYMTDQKNASVAVCGVKLLDENGDPGVSCARFPNAKNLLLNSLGLDRFPFFKTKPIFMTSDELRYTQEVDQIIGAFYVIRRKIFKDLRGFDENFFVYYEEVDLSWRVKQLEQKIIYHADLVAMHIGGGVTTKAKALRTFLSMRSRFIFVKKHMSAAENIWLFPAVLLAQPLIRILTSILVQGRSFKEEFKAAKYLWSWLFFHYRDPRWTPGNST